MMAGGSMSTESAWWRVGTGAKTSGSNRHTLTQGKRHQDDAKERRLTMMGGARCAGYVDDIELGGWS